MTRKQLLKSSFRFSVKRSLPILIGFFPVGFAYGILMADAGYNFLWSAGTSLIVFAGSLQMLVISFFHSDVSLLTITVTALLLNSRHIFYGISFIDKFNSYGKWKYFLIFALPDETYSLLCSYKPTEGAEEKWVHIFSAGLVWLYWVVFSAMGGLVGGLITFNTEGIDFALTALFIVILTDQLRDANNLLPAGIAVFCAVAFLLLLGPTAFLLPALCLTVAAFVMFRPLLDKEASLP